MKKFIGFLFILMLFVSAVNARSYPVFNREEQCILNSIVANTTFVEGENSLDDYYVDIYFLKKYQDHPDIVCLMFLNQLSCFECFEKIKMDKMRQNIEGIILILIPIVLLFSIYKTYQIWRKKGEKIWIIMSIMALMILISYVGFILLNLIFIRYLS